METLGNEALGKIMNIVHDTRFLMDFEQKAARSSRGRRKPQTSVLNILSDARVGVYRGSAHRRLNQHRWTKWTHVMR